MIEAARSIPGVTAAGMVSRTPFTGGMHGIPIYRPGTTEFKLNNSVLAPYVFPMSPGYLETAGARLLSGRFFGEAGLLQGGRRTATVRAWAESEVVVVALDRAAFSNMLAGSAPTREEIARAMHERLADLQGFGALESRHV